MYTPAVALLSPCFIPCHIYIFLNHSYTNVLSVVNLIKFHINKNKRNDFVFIRNAVIIPANTYGFEVKGLYALSRGESRDLVTFKLFAVMVNEW